MISKEDVQKLSRLARLTISDEEASAFAEDAEAILGYVYDVGEASAAGQGDAHTTLTNVMREDAGAHDSGAYTRDILHGAPRRDGDYIAVRKVISKD